MITNALPRTALTIMVQKMKALKTRRSSSPQSPWGFSMVVALFVLVLLELLPAAMVGSAVVRVAEKEAIAFAIIVILKALRYVSAIVYLEKTKQLVENLREC